jgi:hypothetical protein
LLNLYPRAWRRRYGDEVAEMLAGRGFSLRTSIDLVAGAIDVWIHPSATLATAMAAQTKEEERTMFSRIVGFECAAGADVSKADERRAGIVMVAGTLVLTAAWIVAHRQSGGNQYIESLSVMAFIVPLLYSMRYTYLKKRSVAVQAVFISGWSLLIGGFMLAVGWVNAQI